MGAEEPRPDLVAREADRLARSIAEAKRLVAANDAFVVAMHFPPIYADGRPTAFSRIIEDAAPRVCVYGHLHGEAIAAGFTGERNGVSYRLASCDAAGFAPVELRP